MIWVLGKDSLMGMQVCSLLAEEKIPFVSSASELDSCNYNSLEEFVVSFKTNNYYQAHKSDFADAGKITWIINCITFDDFSKIEKSALNVARVCRNNGIKLIQLSSSDVFDGKSNISYEEDSYRLSTSDFGKAMIKAEDAVTSSMNQYYLIRTSFLFGFKKNNFVYDLIEKLNNEDEVSVEKNLVFSPTFSYDLSEIIFKFIEKNETATEIIGKHSAPSYGIYNFCNSGSVSMHDFTVELLKLGKKYKRISKETDVISTENDSQNFCLSTKKIAGELGIKIPDWKKSLEIFLKSKAF